MQNSAQEIESFPGTCLLESRQMAAPADTKGHDLESSSRGSCVAQGKLHVSGRFYLHSTMRRGSGQRVLEAAP